MESFEEYQHYMESYYLSNDNAKSRRKILQDAYDITHDKITELEQKLKTAQNIALEMGLKYNEQNKKLEKLEKDNEAMEKLLAGKTIVCKSTNVAKRLI